MVQGRGRSSAASWRTRPCVACCSPTWPSTSPSSRPGSRSCCTPTRRPGRPRSASWRSSSWCRRRSSRPRPRRSGDRFPRERVLALGYLVQAAAMLLTAAAMASDLPVGLVYLVAAVAATSLVVTRPTQSALLPALSRTPNELTAANGAAGVVEGIGVLIGPLIAALILTSSTTAVVFLRRRRGPDPGGPRDHPAPPDRRSGRPRRAADRHGRHGRGGNRATRRSWPACAPSRPTTMPGSSSGCSRRGP